MEQYKNTVYHGDCLEFMRSVPDGFFDLVLTDPPYGLGDRLSKGSGVLQNRPFKQQYLASGWTDIAPTQEVFDEIMRVSKNQIIWGGNYFDLPPTRGFICWDKKQPMPTLSACEYAWTSFDKPAKLFAMCNINPQRQHPTQKPVELMKFCLNYSKATKGMRVLDPFLGSGTTSVACASMGIDWWGCELEQDYVDVANMRLSKLQVELF